MLKSVREKLRLLPRGRRMRASLRPYRLSAASQVRRLTRLRRTTDWFGATSHQKTSFRHQASLQTACRRCRICRRCLVRERRCTGLSPLLSFATRDWWTKPVKLRTNFRYITEYNSKKIRMQRYEHCCLTVNSPWRVVDALRFHSDKLQFKCITVYCHAKLYFSTWIMSPICCIVNSFYRVVKPNDPFRITRYLFAKPAAEAIEEIFVICCEC